jgi:hypothetical protein
MLSVQLWLRKTQSFVGARSSCSIGAPRTDCTSLSSSPTNPSIPWSAVTADALGAVAVVAAAGSTAADGMFGVSGAGGGAALRAGGVGFAAGSTAATFCGGLISNPVVTRNSGGGLAAQPVISMTTNALPKLRALRPFMRACTTSYASLLTTAANTCYPPLRTHREYSGAGTDYREPASRSISRRNLTQMRQTPILRGILTI